MASDLDEKLREILRVNFRETINKAVVQRGEAVVEFAERSRLAREEAIAQIKQAFKDAGYVLLFESGDKYYDDYQRKRMKLELQHEKDLRNFRECITGQEWYDKFLDALKAEVTVHPSLPKLSQCEFVFRAAKRASGIER